MSLNGKVVVITGASSGIGRATAIAFARQGAKVVLAARSDEQLQEAERECVTAGGQALSVHADVGSNAEVEALGARALEAFGTIDVWVNNAGVMAFGRVEEIPIEDHETVLQTNLLGCLYGSRVAVRQFRKNGAGTLINVASIVGGMAQPLATTYTASKWGVRGLTEAIRVELKDEPAVHVCTVMPSAIDTPIFQHGANYVGQETKALSPAYPPEQVADAIVDLVDNPKSEITVGDAGRILMMFRAHFPDLTDTIMGTVALKGTFTDQPAGPSAGNLHAPSGASAGVSGGWRTRGQIDGAKADTALRLVSLGTIGVGLAWFALRTLKPRRAI